MSSPRTRTSGSSSRERVSPSLIESKTLAIANSVARAVARNIACPVIVAEQPRRGMPRLADAMAAQRGRHRPEQDREVQPQRRRIDVRNVELEALVPRQGVAALHLREAGQAGSNLVAACLCCVVAIEVFHQQGPWSDEAHVAPHHVPKLRELVETRAT